MAGTLLPRADSYLVAYDKHTGERKSPARAGDIGPSDRERMTKWQARRKQHADLEIVEESPRHDVEPHRLCRARRKRMMGRGLNLMDMPPSIHQCWSTQIRGA